MDKFQNKYRIESTRLKNWDYGSSGMYFITICTKSRKHYLGEINKSEMLLNENGKIANNSWYELPKHFKYVELGEFIIMPNHVHGIIIINIPTVETRHALSLPPPQAPIVETGYALSLPKKHPRFRNQGKNTISSMVGSFKSALTRLSTHPDFGWQSRFHDHIIRNYDAYLHISQYIINNPKNWSRDKFYTE